MPSEASLERLIDEHVDGHALPRPFYSDAAILSNDREAALDQLWHIAGHAARIPNAGDYFVFSLCGEEIVVIRDRAGIVQAHYNVCRHRGSRICRERTGNKSVLVCPYHAWTYNLDGSLRAARLMDTSFDKTQHGLHPCHVQVVAGIIFVSLADQPIDFSAAVEPFRDYLTFHGIGNAGIAKQIPLPTVANWKLVVENFIECYHCAPAHPEYSAVHSKLKLLAAGAGIGSGPDDACRKYEIELGEWLRKTRELGHPILDGEFAHGAGMSRMPIKSGSLTESKDGQPVAPLMGELQEYDGGITYIAFNYLNYLLAANDHALLLRFTPISELQTDVEATWLVREDAVAGQDFDPDQVSWVWETTLKQDITITEDNQAGVMSARYSPGPYSTQEKVNEQFIHWYIDHLKIVLTNENRVAAGLSK